MGKLVAFMDTDPKVFIANAVGKLPTEAFPLPVLEPLIVRALLHKEFDFHLLKLTGPEDKISRGNFIPETFPDLCDAKREFLPGALKDVAKIDEDPLGRLRSQVNGMGRIFHGTHEGLKHQIELTWGRKLSAASGAFSTLGVILPETLVACLALHQGIGKTR